VVALGDAAAVVLTSYLSGERGVREQSLAAHALADIASPRAQRALLGLVRSRDIRQRHLGLAGLARSRGRLGRAVLSRPLVHRLFLRELRDYRLWVAPGRGLERDAWPDVRLFGESLLETAEMALARGLNALSCWYDHAPLVGAFERLRSRDPGAISPALEYLGHVLPRLVFRPLSRVFEEELSVEPVDAPDSGLLERAIRQAWESGDGWLRACAVRASRHLPGFDRGLFEATATEDPLVAAEMIALDEIGRLEQFGPGSAEAGA
jgi:hypothetical protein